MKEKLKTRLMNKENLKSPGEVAEVAMKAEVATEAEATTTEVRVATEEKEDTERLVLLPTKPSIEISNFRLIILLGKEIPDTTRANLTMLLKKFSIRKI